MSIKNFLYSLSTRTLFFIFIIEIIILIFGCYYIFYIFPGFSNKLNKHYSNGHYTINKLSEYPPAFQGAGETCEFFSFLQYEISGATVKDIYSKAEKLGYITSANLDKVETKTLENFNKNAHPQMRIKEGDIDESVAMTLIVKDGMVYFNYRDKITIQKKVNDIILQMRVEDKYVGPTINLDKKIIVEAFNKEPINIIKKVNDPTLGNLNSPVTITVFVNFDLPSKEYGDYQREDYLEKINKLRDEYISEGKVYLVLKHFSLPGQENAINVAEAAQCAHMQGKFWEMHDIIFASQFNQSALNYDSFIEWANDLELNINKYKECLVSGQTRDFIKESYNEATSVYQISGVPNFFVNGRNIKNQNYPALQYVIDQELGVEKDYIKTMFDLGVLNACKGGNFTPLLKQLFVDLELDPNIVEKIPLERNQLLYPLGE